MTKPTRSPADVDSSRRPSPDEPVVSQNTADPTDGAEAQKLRDKMQKQEKAEGD